ncbi:hypothetical protein CP556_14365 [Natrinema sp. CBA1119]|uniref:lamin tail domain-containing protein n=1 Tax=Natrinema sp. CBA1119 TaxID=1608465 RepID=UPI000BF58516|nr:lamin tail domain-containing protein [Natrinema sp. CBA1119]PGF17182.1 hypothetical protein CP556_14365 [Natrinema sp. CBA1119]
MVLIRLGVEWLLSCGCVVHCRFPLRPTRSLHSLLEVGGSTSNYAETADRGAGAFVVVDEGAPIWSASHDVGPGRGAIAADGGTWSTIVTDLATESARLTVYRTPDAVAEPESAPPRDAPPTGEDSAAEDDESSDDTDDSAGDDDDDEDDESPSDPVSLALADYHILGEQASAEYLTLRNTGDGPLELSGWTIRDRRDGGRVGNSASPFEFPRGFTLEPGATVTISTGTGEPTADTLYWGYSGDFQIWHEEGDVVIVRDTSGTVVLEQEIAADQPPDPPGDDPPDEEPDQPTDPPSGDEPDDPTESPTGEPADGPANPPVDDTADPPTTSGGADGAEPNRTDGA